jgi:uncharacterized protein with HEPN domain
MDDAVKTWLYDIFNAINEIDSFFEGKPKRFIEYQQDIRTKRAVERNMEIIGEAMNRILKHQPEISITASRRIVDLRNRIIHSYDAISDELIWGIVINSLPVLKEEVSILLNN